MKMILTLVFAVLMQMVPVSGTFKWFQPNFVALFVIFWMIYAPGALTAYSILILGLLCDVLFGTVLGEHSFSLLITAYCVYRLLRPLRVWPLWQQFLLIFFILIINQLAVAAVKLAQGYDYFSLPLLLLAPFMGLVLWPLIRNVFIGFAPRSTR